ncbi:hypothetical protein MBLNU13_g10960t1 [Cladosporium sp. NU13]
MAGSREPVFTNDEKNYMLAEIIKSVSPSPTTMLNLVMQLGAHQPRWDDMPLPPGRSVNACRAAFEDLKRSSGFSPLSQTTAPQTPLSAPIGPLRRPWQLETTTSYPTGPPGRQLAPKPKTEGQGGVVVMPQASATPGAQAKRKRGRPTKAEAQAKAAESSAAAAAGTIVRRESAITPRVAIPGPSAAPSPAPAPASAPATIASPSVEPQPKPALPPTSRVPISAMITTPTTQKTSSHSGSSSGKRRRRKSMRSDQDDHGEGRMELSQPQLQLQQSQPQHQQQQQRQSHPYPHYESPYSRIDPDDTPARSTGVRHYEDTLPGIQHGARLPPTNFASGYPGRGPGSAPGSGQGQPPSQPPSR